MGWNGNKKAELEAIALWVPPPPQEKAHDYIDIFINCNWVVTRWQYTFTHKQYIEQHK
jgi:hypothetical protein